MDLQAETQAKAKELASLNEMLVAYPKAKSFSDRWGTTYYVAAIPLDHPDLWWDFRRSCGCCVDSLYQISLYLILGKARIHPEGWYRRTLSFANEWSGSPNFDSDSVRASLEEKGLPPRIIESALAHLGYHRSKDEEE